MSERNLIDSLIWDFSKARSCSLIHKKPYETRTRNRTKWYDENGVYISDFHKKYMKIKKAEGRTAADIARKKWTSKEDEVQCESYYVDKFWEVSGMVIGRRDNWMCSLDMVPSKRPFIVGLNTLDNIIAAKSGTMNIQQQPRHEMSDWCGIGVVSFCMPLVVRRLGIKCEIDNPHFYSQHEILLIANETVSMARQYFDWWIGNYPGGPNNPYLKNSLGIRPLDDVYDVISDRLAQMYYDAERDLQDINSNRLKSLELMKDFNYQTPKCWENGFLF